MSLGEQVEQLAQRVVEQSRGPPGSGKSTIVEILLKRINELMGADSSQEAAICVSLDGWHMYRHELDAMADPVEAHWRRGAAFTFDMGKYLTFVRALRDGQRTTPIPFFLFSHSTKDPTPSPTPILPLPQHRVVIIEGLYTHLNTPGWIEAANAMDIRLWIDVERDIARSRVLERNFAAGLANSREECEQRVDAVDMVNGEFVRENRIPPTDTIVSVDDPSIL